MASAPIIERVVQFCPEQEAAREAGWRKVSQLHIPWISIIQNVTWQNVNVIREYECENEQGDSLVRSLGRVCSGEALEGRLLGVWLHLCGAGMCVR